MRRICPKCGGNIRRGLVDGRCHGCIVQERVHADLKARHGAGGCGHAEESHKLTADVAGLWRKCAWCPCVRPASLPHSEGVIAS